MAWEGWSEGVASAWGWFLTASYPNVDRRALTHGTFKAKLIDDKGNRILTGNFLAIQVVMGFWEEVERYGRGNAVSRIADDYWALGKLVWADPAKGIRRAFLASILSTVCFWWAVSLGPAQTTRAVIEQLILMVLWFLGGSSGIFCALVALAATTENKIRLWAASAVVVNCLVFYVSVKYGMGWISKS